MNLQSNTSFNEILTTIQDSKQKAYSQVNNTLIELYWNIGKYISTKTIKENWGKGVVKELAEYIKVQDITLKGFSDKNLWRMKQFYEAYKENKKLSALLRELSWTNNLLILSASKSDIKREFYLNLSINEGIYK
ncbi:MAG: hypothetical protein KAQ94_05540 [Arcobacteraceae bacterium]|nr:hypothetical protein [Arcobacteraceae bacterium]